MLINENYKIESDTLNVTLFHRTTGKKNWLPIGYFSDPYNALNFLMKYEIMGEGLADFQTVCQKIDELTRLINSLNLSSDTLQCLPRITKDKTGGKHRAEVVTASASGSQGEI
jgi:hypothetical protein